MIVVVIGWHRNHRLPRTACACIRAAPRWPPSTSFFEQPLPQAVRDVIYGCVIRGVVSGSAKDNSMNASTLLVDGLRVLVTAGAAGIGRAIVDTFVANGARVHICDNSADALEACGREQPTVSRSYADVSDEAAVDRLFTDVSTQLGGLDVLVNNAGIAGPTGAIDAISTADWKRTIDINLTGQFLCARRAAPMLRATAGVLLNVSSVAGRLGYAVSHPVCRNEMGDRRLKRESRQGTRRIRRACERPFAGHR